MKIEGKNFLVTGGASGLGEACVRNLVKIGGKVIIADLNQERGAALQAELGEQQTIFCTTNVCEESDVSNSIKLGEEKFGPLRGAINCAGIGTPNRVLSKEGDPLDLSEFSKVININLIGTFNIIRLAAAAMATHDPLDTDERGVIINTASVAAFDGQIGQAAYSASKGGVVAMTLPIARELSRKGIRLMTIAPGIFDTPMLAGLPQEARDSLGMQVPFPPRLGDPNEYARLAQHIFENVMLNGEVIRLDGAIRMAPK